MGNTERAGDLLRQRLTREDCSEVMTTVMSSLLAITENRFPEAVSLMRDEGRVTDAEMLFYFARHHARIENADDAIRLIEQASRSGFLCSPHTLRADPWLATVRAHSAFPDLLRHAEKLMGEARSLWQATAPRDFQPSAAPPLARISG
jgi:hypothetical protein